MEHLITTVLYPEPGLPLARRLRAAVDGLLGVGIGLEPEPGLGKTYRKPPWYEPTRYDDLDEPLLALEQTGTVDITL